MKTVKTKTKCGEIKGISFDEHLEFRGIRYANAKRWEYPTQVEAWDGVYDATQFGACSPQHRAFEDDAVVNAFYHKEFRKGLSFTYDEDCLFLNIWAPKKANDCPVLIYIHGGSFTGGSADEGHISGKEFAKHGIIFVAMNYRLGAFGFCSHPDLTNDKGICGNFGLYDQYISLKWIKENIESFGGNPNKMTLIGQSAGAMSVDIQITNPLMKNWFQGAILMSGAAMQRGFSKPLSPEKNRGFWEAIMANAGVSSIAELKELEAEKLYFAWKKACKDDIRSMQYTLPCIDGEIITEDNFKMKTVPSLPTMIGVTKNDMVPIVLKSLAHSWVNHYKGDNCYVYMFDRDLPGDNVGSYHSCDLLYAFSTLDFNWRPFEKIDYEISNQLAKSIYAFVKTANPNCNAIPKWEPGDKKVMTFCEDTKMKHWNDLPLIKYTIKKKG